MGLQDRDYMHERRRGNQPFSPPRPARAPTLTIVLAFVVVLFALYKGANWWLDHRVTLMQRPVVTAPVTAASPGDTPPAQQPTNVSAVAAHEQPPTTTHSVTKCVVNGRTSYSDTDCPRSATVEQITPQSDQHTAPAPTTPRDAIVTIYLCEAYNGGTFWSSANCHQHRALIDSMVSVPSSLPFDQQVALAEGEASARQVKSAARDQETVRLRRCETLQAERDKIWSRYSNRQLQPPDVIGQDRSRTLGIQAEQQRLGCPTQ